jgi:uncharacterized protein
MCRQPIAPGASCTYLLAGPHLSSWRWGPTPSASRGARTRAAAAESSRSPRSTARLRRAPLRRVAPAAAALLAAALACGGPRPAITPLARAARTGNTAAIRSMVAAGQDVNAPDPGGNHWTPLLHAIHKGQRGAIDALLAAGANVHGATAGQRVGVDAAANLTPLMMAVGNGQADIVRRLLAAGADPRADGPGLFAIAVSGGALTDIENPLLGRCNADVVRALLERDPTLRLPRNGRGHLAILFARLNNCHEVTRLVASR